MSVGFLAREPLRLPPRRWTADGMAVVTAVRGWRFEPGRLGETPVEVLIAVVMDFTIR